VEALALSVSGREGLLTASGRAAALLPCGRCDGMEMDKQIRRAMCNSGFNRRCSVPARPKVVCVYPSTVLPTVSSLYSSSLGFMLLSPPELGATAIIF